MGMQDLKKIQCNDESTGSKQRKVVPINKAKTNNENEISEKAVEYRPHRRRSKPRFEDTHIRFTSYFRNDIYERVEKLRDEGKVDSLTELINESVRKYLDTYY